MSAPRLVITAVATIGLVSLVLIGLLSLRDKAAPDVLVATASGSLTGLVGLLVPRPGDEN